MSRPEASRRGRSVRLAKHRLAVVALAALVPLTAPAAAEPSPTQARGFSAERAFDIGEFDAVNPFNFNLVLALAVGPEYPLSEALSYGLTLTYNASAWDYQLRDETPPCALQEGCRTFTQAIPARHGNAGMGWLLSFGKLDAPYTAGNDTGLWKYTSPDGGEHLLFPTLHEGETSQAGVFYSRDSTYLRLEGANTSVRTLGFPDGARHTFNSGGTLTRIEDRFGNALNVTITATRWDLSDNHGRTHKVHFSADGQRVTRVELAAFNGTIAVYDFGYATADVTRACSHNDPELGPLVNVYLLTSITRPDQTTFSMPVSDYVTAENCMDSGRIRGMTLPTRGRLTWEYRSIVFPLDDAAYAGGGLEG
jgi:hypothetical protein